MIDYSLSNESEFKAWLKDAKNNRGLVFKSNVKRKSGEGIKGNYRTISSIKAEQDFILSIRMMSHLDKDIGDWFI